MTTLLGKDKSVEYSLSTEILLRDNMFRLEPIKIACSSKKDAEYIQEKVNKLISEISKELIKEEN